jgi:hypothetical protein
MIEEKEKEVSYMSNEEKQKQRECVEVKKIEERRKKFGHLRRSFEHFVKTLGVLGRMKVKLGLGK